MEKYFAFVYQLSNNRYRGLVEAAWEMFSLFIMPTNGKKNLLVIRLRIVSVFFSDVEVL